MTFVITQGCCNDASCISVCPVQCIRPRPGDLDFTSAEQLYIDPGSCIDCGACVAECPVGVIQADDDLDPADEAYLAFNADYFIEHPIEDTTPLPDVRLRLPSGQQSLRVAIVGSGPAACYAAEDLGSLRGVEVSVFDRLPTPFGLVRSGVAADHPQTKLMAEQFRNALSRKSVSCFFNVEVGVDISIEELLEHHHAVIWAAGVEDDNHLGIPGEDLAGCHSAREFVAWYNGHPDHAVGGFDLTGENVVVIGNGNVGLDVARAVALPAARFETTDMAAHAVDALRDSKATSVIVAARRGPAQAAFTLSELVAMADSPELTLRTDAADLARADMSPTVAMSALRQRKVDILRGLSQREVTAGTRSVDLRFLLTPLEIHGESRVEAVTFARNVVHVVDGVMSVEPTGETEMIRTSLVLRAIGYRGRPVDGLPFDERTGTIIHEAGRVLGRSAVYCAGWVKRGASGVIGTNREDSRETVSTLLADLAAGALSEPVAGTQQLAALVAERKPDFVDNAGWLKIDRAERARGGSTRPRLKFIAIEDMLAAVRGEGVSKSV